MRSGYALAALVLLVLASLFLLAGFDRLDPIERIFAGKLWVSPLLAIPCFALACYLLVLTIGSRARGGLAQKGARSFDAYLTSIVILSLITTIALFLTWKFLVFVVDSPESVSVGEFVAILLQHFLLVLAAAFMDIIAIGMWASFLRYFLRKGETAPDEMDVSA